MFQSQRISFLRGVAVGAVISLFSGLVPALADAPSPFRGVPRIAAALSLIDAHYVDPVDPGVLLEGAVRGMTGTLDPYSEYLDAEEYDDFQRATTGRFVGVGVEIESRDGWLVVVSVFPGGPAEQAGVRAGDKVLSIDDAHARDMRVSDAVERVRGEAGTTVRLSLRRAGVDEAVRVELRRAPVQFASVESRLLPGRVLYVRVRAFQEDTADDFADALDRGVLDARAQGGLAGVVVDLRANGGGLLSAAVRIADEFLAEGVIVSTRGRLPRWSSDQRAVRRGTRPGWPLAVIIDANSASASEVLAGALRDSGRATLVGTRSFGKGTVQEIVPLPEGGAIKLTIARFFSPSGRRIHEQGVEPHVALPAIESRPDTSLEPSSLMADTYVVAALTALRSPVPTPTPPVALPAPDAAP